MTEHERTNAKHFFKALANLNEANITLLAEKYHTDQLTTSKGRTRETDVPILDRILAKRRGVNLTDYQKQRRTVEHQLLNKIVSIAEIDEQQLIPMRYFLAIEGEEQLYLTKYEQEIGLQLTFTNSQFQAQEFKRYSIGDQLATRFGLIKVTID